MGDKALDEIHERHSLEVACLQRRVEELEDRLRRETEERDRRIKELEERSVEQGWISRVGEFLPHAGRVTQFLHMLPSYSGPENHGLEIMAPVWRCVACALVCQIRPRSQDKGAWLVMTIARHQMGGTRDGYYLFSSSSNNSALAESPAFRLRKRNL